MTFYIGFMKQIKYLFTMLIARLNIVLVANELSDAAPPKGVSPMSDCLYDSVACTKLSKEN